MPDRREILTAGAFAAASWIWSPLTRAAPEGGSSATGSPAHTANVYPLKLTRGDRLLLAAQVNGHDVEALLDSAAEASFLDRAFAQRIGLAGSGVGDGQGFGREEFRRLDGERRDAERGGSHAARSDRRDLGSRRRGAAAARPSPRHDSRSRAVRRGAPAHRHRAARAHGHGRKVRAARRPRRARDGQRHRSLSGTRRGRTGTCRLRPRQRLAGTGGRRVRAAPWILHRWPCRDEGSGRRTRWRDSAQRRSRSRRSRSPVSRSATSPRRSTKGIRRPISTSASPCCGTSSSRRTSARTRCGWSRGASHDSAPSHDRAGLHWTLGLRDRAPSTMPIHSAVITCLAFIAKTSNRRIRYGLRGAPMSRWVVDARRDRP